MIRGACPVLQVSVKPSESHAIVGSSKGEKAPEIEYDVDGAQCIKDTLQKC